MKGRPRKVSQEDYHELALLLGGSFGNEVTDRTVRNWVTVTPLGLQLVKIYGVDVSKHYFTNSRGDLSMRLLLKISKLPEPLWIPVSKSVMKAIDKGASRSRVVDIVDPLGRLVAMEMLGVSETKTDS